MRQILPVIGTLFLSVIYVKPALATTGFQFNSLKIELQNILTEHNLVNKRSNWAQGMAQIEKSFKQKNLSEQQVIDALNLQLHGLGLPKESLLSTNHFHWQQYSGVSLPLSSGIITERRGKYRYVKYTLPSYGGDDLRRGDRITPWPGFANTSLSHTELRTKSNPMKSEQTLKLEYLRTDLTRSLSQFSLDSSAEYSLGDAKITYIHLLDCSKNSVPGLIKQLRKKKTIAHVIDLRDSFCQDSSNLVSSLISSKLRRRSIYFLINGGTRYGAEHAIRTLKKEKNVWTIGESTAGLWHGFEMKSIQSKYSMLLPPKRKDLGKRLDPDYYVKDQIMFSEGQDSLRTQALEIVRRRQNS